jgi:hypothetical protein
MKCGQSARSLLAKLVIAGSALVALASSPPPRWGVQQRAQLELLFDEREERTAILSIELSGQLYAAAGAALVELVTTSERAGELTVTARPLPASAAPPDRTEQASDAQASAEFELVLSNQQPDLGSPGIAWLSVPLECAQDDPPARRPRSCIEQFEITLTRPPGEPLSVELSATVSVDGPGQPPPGTLRVLLGESAP